VLKNGGALKEDRELKKDGLLIGFLPLP